ncbi:MAG: DPP IV N-terminal domain-containing protein [Bacteroidia bacterium]
MRFKMLWIFLVGCLMANAQDRTLNIQEAIAGYHLYPTGLYQLQWIKGSHMYSQLERTEEGFNIMINSSEVEMEPIRINLDHMNSGLSKSRKDSIKRLPYPQWINDHSFGFKHKDEFLVFDINNQSIKRSFEFKKGASEIVYTANLDGYAGVIENGFAYEVNKRYGSVTSTTNGHVLGRTVHRSEFGIHNGLFLSPDGSKLAYYFKNEQMVSEYPLYNLKGTPATADMIRYPTAGGTSHEVTVRVKHIGSDKADVVLKIEGPKDQYLTNVSWTPDNKSVLVAVVNREQNHMWLNQYDAGTGAFVKTLFEETHDKYVEPEHPAEFTAHNPNQFVWWSEKDGYNHLYLHNADGSLVQQLTKGEWVVTEFFGFNTEGTEIFISATKESPIDRHLYCVNLKSGKMKKITSGDGVHRITANSDNTYFIDNYSSPETPRAISIINDDGAVIEELYRAMNPLEEFKEVEMEIGTITGNSNHELYYRMFKPADFDPKKEYPAVVYLYNGPHAQLITNSWLGGANLWYPYMAQNGYVVFTIEGRGSANRGLEFENAIFRNAGAVEMEDQLTGLDWLKAQSFVDSSRIGIHGWSYGGFMTINLMTRTPGKYKVGVAGGPVIDWDLYEVMYTERYMDTPEENPEGYESTDLKNYVTNLQGDLLIIHGGQDNVVLWEHSLEYIEQAIKQGVQLDYFVYPHHEHNVLGPDRVHLYEKVSNYFFDHL